MNETAPPSLPTAADVAAYLAAKLCHDLISPTSAIVSGVDLIEDPESQDMRDDAMNLIAASSRKLGAMLQFCRVAFGASASADTFDVRDLQKLTEGVYASYKAQQDWAVTPESLNKPAARTLLNLAQLASGALPRGGVARIEATPEGDGIRISVGCTGLRVALRPEIIEGLSGKPMSEGMAGYWIQAYYVSLIVSDAGGTLEWDVSDEAVSITAHLPAA